MEATTSLGGRWSSLPGHLLESISDHLPLADSLNFRAVCRHWRSSSSAWSNITKFARDEPCLMFYDLPNGGNDGSGTTTCYFYSRDHAECCVARLPHLQGATVVMSKLNWLLVHRHNDDFFFFNPFTLEKIDLPKHAVASDQVYTFQKHPRFNSCIVIIVTRWSDSVLEVSTVCPVRDSKWSKRTIDVSRVQFGKLTYVMPWHDQTICISDSKSMFTVNPHERQLYLKYFDRGLDLKERRVMKLFQSRRFQTEIG